MKQDVLDQYALQLLQVLDNALFLASQGRSVGPEAKRLGVIKSEFKKATESDTARNTAH